MSHHTTPAIGRLRARVAMTGAAWAAAFLVASCVQAVLGDRLRTLPAAVQALVMSGVLVAVMVNVVGPALQAGARRWSAGQGRGSDVERPLRPSSDDARER